MDAGFYWDFYTIKSILKWKDTFDYLFPTIIYFYTIKSILKSDKGVLSV